MITEDNLNAVGVGLLSAIIVRNSSPRELRKHPFKIGTLVSGAYRDWKASGMKLSNYLFSIGIDTKTLCDYYDVEELEDLADMPPINDSYDTEEEDE